MRIFIHLKGGETIIQDVQGIQTKKGILSLHNAKGASIYNAEMGKVHRIEILPELWKI